MGKRYAEFQAVARSKKTKLFSKPAPFAAKVESIMRSKEEAKDILTNVSLTGLGATTTPVFYPISLVATGTDATNRLGRKISYKHAQLSVVLRCVGTGSTTNASGNFWVVYDRQVNGAVPGFFSAFTYANSSQHGSALKNTQTFHERFKVLAKKEFSLSSLVSGQNNTIQREDIFIPLDKVLRGRDRCQNFNGVGATIGDVDTGAIYIVTGIDGSVGTASLDMTCYSKVRFIDA